ncbi:MAG: hypothetical protein NW237_04350 [Cyanobacteriota bacterium]|nr:hypothetical protein [Cyanobacteriota bacterium]
MTIPYLQSSKVSIFIEAAKILLVSSQQLLDSAVLEADLPLAIDEALQIAQAYQQAHADEWRDPEQQERIQQIQDILKLLPPLEILGLIRDVIDQGQGADLESFLDALPTIGSEMTSLRYPKILVCPEAMSLWLSRLDSSHFSCDDQQALHSNLAEMQLKLEELAQIRGVDLTLLRLAVQERLRSFSTDQLAQVLQAFLLEDELESGQNLEGSQAITVAGPVLLMQIIDHLLDHEGTDLTSDQQLDLQMSRVKAEAKYRAMQKLGRIENLEQQQEIIRDWIATQSTHQLWVALGEFFASAENDADEAEI